MFENCFRPRAALLGYLSSAGVYDDQTAYPSAVDVSYVKIFRFDENIYYANVDMFKKLFAKRIAFQFDNQMKAMTNEIKRIEDEYRTCSTKSNKLFMYFQRRLNKRNTHTIDIDLTTIEKEKHDKVGENNSCCRHVNNVYFYSFMEK
jgi:hypothetical protein